MENEKTLSQQIAEISTQLKLSDIDQRTIDNAKIFMLDCLGCILSGSQIINAKVIRKSAQDISGDGPCTIFGTGAKVNPMMAALDCCRAWMEETGAPLYRAASGRHPACLRGGAARGAGSGREVWEERRGGAAGVHHRLRRNHPRRGGL